MSGPRLLHLVVMRPSACLLSCHGGHGRPLLGLDWASNVRGGRCRTPWKHPGNPFYEKGHGQEAVISDAEDDNNACCCRYHAAATQWRKENAQQDDQTERASPPRVEESQNALARQERGL